jgi:hypothetical protein
MADEVSGVLKELKRMRGSIEEAILALERIEVAEAPPNIPASASGTKSASTTRRSEGQKARYAAKRAAEAPAVLTKTAPRKGGMSAEGKKRLIAALKARWAVKKAAAGALPVTKVGRPKKAA